jgi:hypothetical protein
MTTYVPIHGAGDGGRARHLLEAGLPEYADTKGTI